MSSIWPSALASIDDSLAALDASLQQLEAARPINLDQVTARLQQAADSAHRLRSLIISEVPAAQWQDRSELEALLKKRGWLHGRALLLALANELEYGSISHRRAARVTQLNQLREEAVDELRALAAEDEPAALPGPEASRWIEWASALKEPDDTAALQNLRARFARLDEFVATLEPGMWVVPTVSAPPTPPDAVADAALAAQDLEQRRARLLALASELERGEVVHHRAIRVTQVNQLREQAIQELRFQAVVARAPALLPGPEAERWIQWASSLKEPEDAEALQHLREGFVRLDEFITNLEPDMWVPAVAARSDAVSPSPQPQKDQPRAEGSRSDTAERKEAPTAPAPVESAPTEPGFAKLVPPQNGTSPLLVRLTSGVAAFWRGKWRIVLPAGVLLLALLGAMQWRLHRTQASTPPKAAEVAAPENAGSVPEAKGPELDTASANSVSRAPDANQKVPKSKDASDASKAATTPPTKPAVVLDASSLLTPQAMPKQTTLAKADEPNNPADTPGTIPGGLPGGVPDSVSGFSKEISVAAPKLPTQKIRVSSGVAQGQLIHQVTPVYPSQARLTGIRGTVVLQAVIGKDGKVQNVRAVSGPSMLVQSAVDAVKQWRYKPFAVNGEPAEADVEVNVNFNP